jgi:hypothetical protein
LLLPLATAARLVYARATGRHTSDLVTLNEVARMIAEKTRVYLINADETARPLPAELVAGSQFEDGGDALRLKNSKRLGSLAIRRDELWDVADEVRKVYGGAAR